MLRLISGFGGGLGGLRVTCGTVSAMCLVMSWLHGYDEAEDFEGKKHLYATEQRMAARFTDKYGTLSCRELLTAAGIQQGVIAMVSGLIIIAGANLFSSDLFSL